MIKQCTTLVAKQDMQYTNPETNRVCKIKAGKQFWVSNSSTDQQAKGLIQVARMNQALSQGIYMREENVLAMFEIGQ